MSALQLPKLLVGAVVEHFADLVGGRPIRADGALRYMTIQNEGGTRRTIERGLEELRGIAELANHAERALAPISAITAMSRPSHRAGRRGGLESWRRM